MFTVEITLQAPDDAGTVVIVRHQATRQGKPIETRQTTFDEAVRDAKAWLRRNDPHEKIYPL